MVLLFNNQHLHSIKYSMIRLFEDVRTVLCKDPSAKSFLTVMLTHNGIRALRCHRISHWFYKRKFYLISMLISRHSTKKNGLEIHPGAIIGRRALIDHGLGVVIGETAVIGDDVTIYQGVTLGARKTDNGKRHPTIKNGVTIGAGSIILGNIVIGEYSKIGAGSVVLEDIPPYTTVVRPKARPIKR